MKPAVIYAAKSTEDTHGSIPDQLADGRTLAGERGFEVVAEFQDESASAYKGNRGPGLAAALAECERLAGEHDSEDDACGLIVQHSDRLARGDGKRAKHLVWYAHWALERNIRIISVQDPEMFGDGDYGILMSAVGGIRNTQDSKRKGLAVKDGIRRRAVDQRRYVGGRRPYGYRWEPERKPNGDPITTKDGRIVQRLEIDEHEAAIVRRMFSEYLAGVSQRSIAIGLNDDHVRTLTGTRWYATTVRGMLQNPLYKGWLTHNGESFPAVGPDGRATHGAIIDAVTWERARQQREGLSKTIGGGRGRKPRGSHVLTNGLLLCTCGSPMSPVTKPTRTPGRLYEVYTCTRRLHHGLRACAQPPIKREAIDVALWSYFADVALDLDSTRQLFTEQASGELVELDVLRQQAERELARGEARLSRITRGWQDEIIDDADYKMQRAEVLSERDAARAQAERLKSQRDAVAASIAEFDAEAALLQELAALRKLVAGEAQAAGREGCQSFRVALRRLFVGFELVPIGGRPHFGTGKLDGELWQGESPSFERDGTTYVLWPYVRSEAMRSPIEAGDEWPALQREALLLHDNLCTRLAAW